MLAAERRTAYFVEGKNATDRPNGHRIARILPKRSYFLCGCASCAVSNCFIFMTVFGRPTLGPSAVAVTEGLSCITRTAELLTNLFILAPICPFPITSSNHDRRPVPVAVKVPGVDSPRPRRNCLILMMSRIHLRSLSLAGRTEQR